jgi:hypothetical protein
MVITSIVGSFHFRAVTGRNDAEGSVCVREINSLQVTHATFRCTGIACGNKVDGGCRQESEKCDEAEYEAESVTADAGVKEQE